MTSHKTSRNKGIGLVVFAAAWNSGLATALYTSLGAGVIGGIVVTLIYSRYLMTRMKRLETLVGLRISEIVGRKIEA